MKLSAEVERSSISSERGKWWCFYVWLCGNLFCQLWLYSKKSSEIISLFRIRNDSVSYLEALIGIFSALWRENDRSVLRKLTPQKAWQKHLWKKYLQNDKRPGSCLQPQSHCIETEGQKRHLKAKAWKLEEKAVAKAFPEKRENTDKLHKHLARKPSLLEEEVSIEEGFRKKLLYRREDIALYEEENRENEKAQREKRMAWERNVSVSNVAEALIAEKWKLFNESYSISWPERYGWLWERRERSLPLSMKIREIEWLWERIKPATERRRENEA